MRALEVHELTGKPVSRDWNWSSGSVRPSVRLFGLQWRRSELYARVDRRVLAMVDDGLFEEARALVRRDPPPGRSASQCIGYKEILEGERAGQTREEIIERIQRSTRRFVKRQLTWFRKLPVRWIPVDESFDAAVVAGMIAADLASGGPDGPPPEGPEA